jgi:glycosyltransferase involved in cell wall biosynthesis
MGCEVVINARFLTNPLTGVQRYAFEVTRRLPNTIRVIAPQPVAPSYEFLSSATIVDPLGKFVRGGALGHLWEQVALLRWVEKGDLLWSPCGAGPLAVQKQVLTIHDIAYLEHPEWFNRRFVSWYQFLVPRLVHRVQQIIAISEFTKARLVDRTKVSPKKIVVIPNGVDPRFHPKPQEEVTKVRGDLGIPSSNYVLSLGSLEPRKNLNRLLKAWENICHKLPDDVWLVVAGAKGKSLVFRDISFDKWPPRVYLTGYVPDKYLPALYSGALAFVYVSLYEGFGLPPLEAMACRTPVVTSNVASIPEVVGDAAVLVDPDDVESIVWGIRKIVEDKTLRKKLRHNGLERAKKFTWDRTAELTWRVLKETAQGDDNV